MRHRQLSLTALVAAAVVALSGCAAGPTEPQAGLSIVATTTQVADFTRSVVGDTADVKLTQLIQPNQSAHSFDPSAADLTALGHADVLVVNGVGLETWLDDAIAASGFGGVTIDASTGITLLDGDNPHVWTDPRNANAMVDTIAAGLGDADAPLAAGFDANATAYGAELTLLDEWTRDNIDAVPAAERLLVSNHDALGYFTAAYDVTYVGSVIPSFDDNAEPSAAEIDKLVAAIAETGVKAVFSEASLNPKAAQTIADEAGVRVYSGPDALYVDSLGPAGSDGETYIGAQLHNVTRILESWGVTPSSVPAGLE
ncbi:metal ABC transporter substrate-binding protein [Cryobacterium tagatosivorans]|uniref:Zinc ABC transporter substrate-binding protein n=1 Tax=Cryobacterium tagatosivorans TaxID=1259199 RepID=A0A4R8UHQ9_9MICO|nr:metal ABC transporter substrate-binding protein [Cryobacterium tagatosivorans]TFB52547.1 zinc ABC transporter substrate-binding protein [Cryobacterium tagatosivorans]